MISKCPKCGKDELEEVGEGVCYECNKKMKKFICMNCLTYVFECGHIAPEKRQCTATKSR
ncbi:MAG: hypothetical protein ACTSRG_19415 [Candidatus Helarchaeota archaeon]